LRAEEALEQGMASLFAARDAPVARRIEEMSGIRPVTLLIAFGIVLITGILIATGIAANQLRHQALSRMETELGRIDGVLVEATSRSFNTVDAQLAEIADHLRQATTGNATTLREAAAAPETLALMRGKLGRFPPIAAMALITDGGEVIGRAGAWPQSDAARADGARDVAWRDLFVASRARSAGPGTNGAPVPDPRTGAFGIPLAHRITGPEGAPVAIVVGLIPAADFAHLFAAAALTEDAVIGLLRPDGMMLARYPEQAGSIARQTGDADFAAVFGDSAATMVRYVIASGGNGRIEAVRPLADYPVAVTVSRNTDSALAGWARQGLWFGAFTLVGAAAIGIMVYLIAHKFQSHATIAAIRAENIEIERARFAAEAELLKSERLSVLGQLTATVAHELRNPLSAIRNTLFTVKELVSTAGLKLDRPIGRMERSIGRCDRIISDLLEYARTRELTRTSVRFDGWIADVLAEQTLTPSAALDLEPGAGNSMVPIDTDRLRRVVINLVENATEALAELPAGLDRRITVRTAAEGGELVLTIADSGPGIAPANLERIFEPLFSTKSFGTGLGLPTVKQIVNQHGGIIVVDSEVGKGTRVTVRLPLDGDSIEEVRVAA
jgi:signal transduction histidine kinase